MAALGDWAYVLSMGFGCKEKGLDSCNFDTLQLLVDWSKKKHCEDLIHASDRLGHTPLHIAALHGNKEIVQVRPRPSEYRITPTFFTDTGSFTVWHVRSKVGRDCSRSSHCSCHRARAMCVTQRCR